MIIFAWCVPLFRAGCPGFFIPRTPAERRVAPRMMQGTTVAVTQTMGGLEVHGSFKRSTDMMGHLIDEAIRLVLGENRSWLRIRLESQISRVAIR